MCRMEPGVVVLFFLQFGSKKTLSEISTEADGFILKMAHPTYEFFFAWYLILQQNLEIKANTYKMQDKIKMKPSASVKFSESVFFYSQTTRKTVQQHLVPSYTFHLSIALRFRLV